MIKAMGSLAGWMTRRPLIWIVAALLPLAGCDSCVGSCRPADTGRIELHRPETPAPPRAQSPVSPVGVSAQTPSAPRRQQTPGAPDGHPGADIGAALERSLAMINQVEKGMTYEEVHGILGAPGILIAGMAAGNQVYRWNYDDLRLMGRFEGGALTRHNIVYRDGFTPPAFFTTGAIVFDQTLYEAVMPGMTFDEVQLIIGETPEPLTNAEGPVTVYKWADMNGSSIIGRFEDMVLARKSGRILDPGAEPSSDTATQEGAAPDVPYRFPITYPFPRDEWPEEEPRVAPHDDTQEYLEDEWYDDDAAQEPTEDGRIHVAGATRREREMADDPSPNAGRSYRPLARLPRYTRSLRRGDFEIRIQNQAPTKIEVGLISEEGGRDLSIPSGRTESVFVGRGIYALYYIYEDDPYTLYQGQRIPVADTLTDFIVDIYDDFYSVSFFDRNLELSRPTSRR